MIDAKDKLYFVLLRAPFCHVRQAYIQRARVEHDRVTDARLWMEEQGYEAQQDVSPDALVTPDGREVVHAHGTSWALRSDVHTKRMAAAFEAAKVAQTESDTKSVVGSESLSMMVCPKCGDAIQHSAVCPACAAGKLGYRHRYTCVCGRVDLISKEAL